MNKEDELNEMSIVRRNKNFNICLKMIMDPDPLPESVRLVFSVLCHTSVEQAVYDKIIYDGIEQQKDGMEDIVEMGAILYCINTRFNQKLHRSDHIGIKEWDEFLLNCILSEMRKRKLNYPAEAKQSIQKKIFKRYCKMDLAYVKEALSVKNPDDAFDDFDDYIEYLLKEERNGVIEIKSFDRLWSLLRKKRDQTFKERYPSKDELYTFCIALALDYDVYCRLQKLLLEKMKEGGQEKTPKYQHYLAFEKRDEILKEFLENIDTRLHIARKEAKCKDFIPEILVKNANYNLQEKGFPVL